MNCPRRYDLETVPDACTLHCPIRRGVRVAENWHSANSATAPGAPAHGRVNLGMIANAIARGTIARVKGKRARGVARVPECGIIAYLLERDADAAHRSARKQVKAFSDVARLARYRRGARMQIVLSELEKRERLRTEIQRGARRSARPLRDAEIADIAGVTRECVRYHKKRLEL